MKKFRFILILIALFTASFSARAQIEVRVKFVEAANLAYQLDCVSGLPVFCSQGNLGELWKREFLKNDDDRALIEQWKNLRELYAQDIRIPGRTSGRNSYVSVFEKIRIAGFQSENIEDFTARFDLLTAPEFAFHSPAGKHRTICCKSDNHRRGSNRDSKGAG